MREAVIVMAALGIALAAVTILVPGARWLAAGAPQAGVAYAERAASP